MCDETRKKPSRKRLWIAVDIIAVLLIGLAILLAVRYYTSDRSDLAYLEDNIKAKLGQLENKSNEEIQAALNEVVEEGNLSISINSNPVFPTGDSEGTLKIENGPQNLYGQQVVITLDETGEEIYDSGYMPVDSHIQTDKLEIDLEPGDYDATAVFTAYDEKLDGAVVGQAIAQLRISVLG